MSHIKPQNNYGNSLKKFHHRISTSNLKKRVYEHKEKLGAGFTKKYNITKLVYYEIFDDPVNAITREKQIKGGSRQKKVDLILKENIRWIDLYGDL